MKIHELQKKWKQGQVSLGCTINGPDCGMTEAYSWIDGLDFVWIDGEHAPTTLEIAQRHIMIAQANGLAAFYRVAWNDRVLAKPILDMGPDAVIFPMIRNAKEAEYAVSICQYPTRGLRSYNGHGRESCRGLIAGEDYRKRADEVFKIMLIEHHEAVEDIDNILRVEGIDSIVVGMSDMSASINKLNELRDAQLLNMLDKVANAAARHNMPMGINMGYDPVIFDEWVQRGACWICMGDEYHFVLNGLKNMVNTSKERLGKFGKQTT